MSSTLTLHSTHRLAYTFEIPNIQNINVKMTVNLNSKQYAITMTRPIDITYALPSLEAALYRSAGYVQFQIPPASQIPHFHAMAAHCAK